MAFAEVPDELVVGVADVTPKTDLTEHAARLGRQLDDRIQLANIEQAAMAVEPRLSSSSCQTCSPDCFAATLPLAEACATRILNLRALDVADLTSAGGVAG